MLLELYVILGCLVIGLVVAGIGTLTEGVTWHHACREEMLDFDAAGRVMRCKICRNIRLLD